MDRIRTETAVISPHTFRLLHLKRDVLVLSRCEKYCQTSTADKRKGYFTLPNRAHRCHTWIRGEYSVVSFRSRITRPSLGFRRQHQERATPRSYCSHFLQSIVFIRRNGLHEEQVGTTPPLNTFVNAHLRVSPYGSLRREARRVRISRCPCMQRSPPIKEGACYFKSC